jgi:hypothetical protein
MFPLTTTLNRIKACNPCDEGWQEGLRASGKTEPDDELISYEAILDAVGLEKALWCCQAEKQHSSLWRRYAIWCARQVQHLMADERSIAALDVAERHANGEATDKELDAAWAAWAAGAAARAARAAARAAGDAAWAAAWDAARAAQAAAFRQLVTTGTLPAVERRPEVAA